MNAILIIASMRDCPRFVNFPLVQSGGDWGSFSFLDKRNSEAPIGRKGGFVLEGQSQISLGWTDVRDERRATPGTGTGPFVSPEGAALVSRRQNGPAGGPPLD